MKGKEKNLKSSQSGDGGGITFKRTRQIQLISQQNPWKPEAMKWHVETLQEINLINYNCTPGENILLKPGQSDVIFDKKSKKNPKNPPNGFLLAPPPRTAPSPVAAAPPCHTGQNLEVLSASCTSDLPTVGTAIRFSKEHLITGNAMHCFFLRRQANV